MALKDYQIPKRDVPLPNGGRFAVRGLSLPDITTLVDRHADTLRALFDHYSGGEQGVALDDLGGVGVSVLRTAPALAAEIIAISADEPDSVETVTKLPFPIQVEALEHVAKLTFDTTGGPKKVIETVIRILRGVSDLSADLRISKAGSLASVER